MTTNKNTNETATATTTTEAIKKLASMPALNDEQIELLKKLESEVEIGERDGVLYTQHNDYVNEDIKIFADPLTEEQMDLIESTKRHYQKVTESTLQKEAHMRAAQQLLNEKARKSFNNACNIAGIISPEKERKNKQRRKVIQTAVDCVTVAAIFCAGVLSAKKYFKR